MDAVKDGNIDGVNCPKCGSNAKVLELSKAMYVAIILVIGLIVFSVGMIGLFVIIFFPLIPIGLFMAVLSPLGLLIKPRYLCRECNHSWFKRRNDT